MKRIPFYFLLSLLFIPLFCQNKNIVFRKNYNPQEISEININLRFESITTSTINGSEIIVEIGTNNTNYLPNVTLAENKLSIIQESWNFKKGDICHVYLYIPAKYSPQIWNLSTQYGNISCDNITAISEIKLKTGEGSYKITNAKSDYFLFESDSESTEIQISNLDCNFFDIFGFVGNIEVSLKGAPQAKSLIRTKEGAISLSLPKNDNFNITARSNNSSFINNFAKSEKIAQNWINYTHNQGGPEIELQTFRGNITIGEK